MAGMRKHRDDFIGSWECTERVKVTSRCLIVLICDAEGSCCLSLKLSDRRMNACYNNR